MRNKAKVTINH